MIQNKELLHINIFIGECMHCDYFDESDSVESTATNLLKHLIKEHGWKETITINTVLPFVQMKKKLFKCILCGKANSPLDYAMKKVGKRYYHEVCLNSVTSFVLKNYHIELDDKLKVVLFEG